jgi:hypothetical protein
VVESRASDHDTSDTASVISSKGKDRFQKRGKYTYYQYFSYIVALKLNKIKNHKKTIT